MIPLPFQAKKKKLGAGAQNPNQSSSRKTGHLPGPGPAAPVRAAVRGDHGADGEVSLPHSRPGRTGPGRTAPARRPEPPGVPAHAGARHPQGPAPTCRRPRARQPHPHAPPRPRTTAAGSRDPRAWAACSGGRRARGTAAPARLGHAADADAADADAASSTSRSAPPVYSPPPAGEADGRRGWEDAGWPSRDVRVTWPPALRGRVAVATAARCSRASAGGCFPHGARGP